MPQNRNGKNNNNVLRSVVLRILLTIITIRIKVVVICQEHARAAMHLV